MLIKLVADIQKVHPFMETQVKDVKKEVDEIKEVQQELAKEDFLDQLANDGKTCAEAKVFEPTKCYKLIYGSITST